MYCLPYVFNPFVETISTACLLVFIFLHSSKFLSDRSNLHRGVLFRLLPTNHVRCISIPPLEFLFYHVIFLVFFLTWVFRAFIPGWATLIIHARAPFYHLMSKWTPFLGDKIQTRWDVWHLLKTCWTLRFSLLAIHLMYLVVEDTRLYPCYTWQQVVLTLRYHLLRRNMLLQRRPILKGTLVGLRCIELPGPVARY